MISFSNFVATARVVVLARKDPGTTSPFSSFLDPVNLTRALFSLRAVLRKVNIRKESSIARHMPNKFVISFKVKVPHVS